MDLRKVRVVICFQISIFEPLETTSKEIFIDVNML